jgi:hypothetical protein
MRTSLAIAAFLLALLFAHCVGAGRPNGVVYKGSWCCQSVTPAGAATTLSGTGCRVSSIACKAGETKLDCTGNTTDKDGNVTCY